MELSPQVDAGPPGARSLPRRRLLLGAVGAVLTLAGCDRRAADSAATKGPLSPGLTSSSVALSLHAEVWKSPFCGCCKLWVRHLQANGFNVVAHDVSDSSVMRKQLGMPSQLGSCHSARIAGYAIEGHVPAADIKRLLAEKPDAIGLSAPGMPIGSPGMEQGDLRDRYDVLLVLRNGQTRVFQSHS